jgi:hypothetical protein
MANNIQCQCQIRDELGHAGGMLVAEKAIDFHGQRAAVLVAEPAGDGGNINAASPAPLSSFPWFPSVQKAEQKPTKETKRNTQSHWCIRQDLNLQPSDPKS